MSKRNHEFKALLAGKAFRSAPCHKMRGTKARNFLQKVVHIYTSWASEISIDVISSGAIGAPVYRFSSDRSEPKPIVAKETTDDGEMSTQKAARHGLLAWLENALILFGTLGNVGQFVRRR